MSDYSRTFLDLAASFHRMNEADLFGHRPDPAVVKSRERFHRRMARRRRHEAVLPYLESPWRAWCESGDAARVARRFLSRHPHLDRPDPADDILTDRQAAAEYHREEAALELAAEHR